MQTVFSSQRAAYVLKALTLGIISLGISSIGFSQISITTINTAYTQNFNTLVYSTNTQSSTLPNGWALYETGSGANSNYVAGVGSTTTNDTYSFGSSTTDQERAFGTLRGNMSSYIGAQFTNNTGSTITQLFISYAGELWRVGTNNNTTDKLNFEYSTIATSLNAAVTWTGVPELEFNKEGLDPALLATSGQKNGNTLRKGISQVITNINIPSGSSLWIRWRDEDVTDNEDGMAVDDFSLIASTGSFGSTVQNAFTFNTANTMAGLGKTPTQTLDIVGNTRTSGKLLVGSITDDDIINKYSNHSLAVNGNMIATGSINGVDGNFSGDLVVKRTPPANTESLSSVSLVNRNTLGTDYRWSIYTSSANGFQGLTPNAFEVWEYPDPAAIDVTPTCCRRRLIIEPSTDPAHLKPVIITPNGNIGIGYSSYSANIPNFNYPLSVNGTIYAQKLKVTQSGWADFVFDEDYKLPSLQSVEEHIKKYKHLPDVPSTTEVEKDGINVGDNQALLLRKIEELTLYILQQQKQMEIQNRQINEMKIQIEGVKK